MIEANKPNTKGTGYHFSSPVQDLVDADLVQQKILDTCVTLPLREILGISVELQRRFQTLTKTRREYTAKTVEVEMLDDEEDVESLVSPELEGHVWSAAIQDYEDTGDASSSRSLSAYSELQLSYDEATENVEDILCRYSSAVKVHPNPLYAMTTGRFGGTLSGLDVTFMVDSGSELNLISEALYTGTSLALDIDGSRWSLKGINGSPVPLVGCCRDVPIVLGGHRLDHHFFVSSEGTGRQDVILGQPWLQWYTANLAYSRTGVVTMQVWKLGDRDAVINGVPVHPKPTLSIQLCAANAPRNADRLVLQGSSADMFHKAYVEEVSDSESEN